MTATDIRSSQPDLGALLAAVLARSPAGMSRIHGEAHWRRVATNGLDLAAELAAERAQTGVDRGPGAGAPPGASAGAPAGAGAGVELGARTGADRLVVVLFAIFHDSMRLHDGRDDDHGSRGGALARDLNPGLMGLSDDRLDLLERACAGHTDGITSDDPTIGTCWDADRLDLCRLGRRIDVRSMSTAPGRTTSAHARARALLEAAPEWPAIFGRLGG